MPADYIIDVERGVVFSKGWGVFTFAEALGYMTRLFRDSRFHPNLNQVVDCRDVTHVELTAEEVREFARRSGFSPTALRAFVVSSDLQFGLSRMYGTYRYAEGVKIFRQMGEALVWLGLPPDADPHPSKAVPPQDPPL